VQARAARDPELRYTSQGSPLLEARPERGYRRSVVSG
jgi:hypothetical protein